MSKKKRLVIIDYTSLLYSACYNNQVQDDKTDNFKEYKNTIDFYTETIFKDLKADYYIAVGDGFTSFRKVKYPKTKADRKGKPPMKFIKDLKAYAYEKYSVITNEVLEADDICLMLYDYYKDKYNTVIASKDGDLRQSPGTFYNYGWRRPLYGKDKPDPSLKQLEEGLNNAIKVISEEQANLNLWKSVLIKGHNNKSNYLTGCGEKTAEAYLLDENGLKGKHSVLDAFIYGIEKDGKNIKRGVKGFGLIKGISEFSKSFEQSYLLRTFDEMDSIFGEGNVDTAIGHQVLEAIVSEENTDEFDDLDEAEDTFEEVDDEL